MNPPTGTMKAEFLRREEHAVVRQAGVKATQNLMADALDLRHRFPLVWARAQDLVCEVWVLRRLTVMARRLTKAQTGFVDAAVVGVLEQHHRAKTHQGYTLRQNGPGSYEWTTPHGIRRIVDHTGTHLPAKRET